MSAVDRWLAAAIADVRARGIEGAVPVLEGFARAMHVLRDADWNADAAKADRGQNGEQRPRGPGR